MSRQAPHWKEREKVAEARRFENNEPATEVCRARTLRQSAGGQNVISETYCLLRRLASASAILISSPLGTGR
jgi:hypothetical protein